MLIQTDNQKTTKSFVIECADDQWRWKAATLAAGAEFVQNALILCAIIFAAFAAALLGYLALSFLSGK